jgi:hypothetical protein
MANNNIKVEGLQDVIDKGGIMSGDSTLTERIKGRGNVISCSCCKSYIFPKKIMFRTTKNNGMVLYNYMGKGGMSCFVQYMNHYFCKDCSTQYRNVLEEIVERLRS